MSAFADLLRAEWAKLRTVRGWVIGLTAAGAAIAILGLAPGMQGTCGNRGSGSACTLPTGPDGGLVTDSFTFVRQSLTGDGSITVRTTSLTGLLPPDANDPEATRDRPGVAPWAKAGLLVKAGTAQGSAYAAVMVTGSHGVRLQHNFTHDTAGSTVGVSSRSPRWLRLTRAGDTVAAQESDDGVTWSAVGTAHLAGLPRTVEAGLFVTSPQYVERVTGSFAMAGAAGGPTQATATFDRLERHGDWASGDWYGERIGGADNIASHAAEPFAHADGVFTVTGSGDVAPAVQGSAGLGTTVTQTLVGTFAGLVLVVVVGTLFVTAEYRRGLIGTTLTAHPRRTAVLAAKAVVLGGVTFVSGLLAATVAVPFGQAVLRSNGVYVAPASTGTELRLIAGTATLLAVAAVLALAIGSLLRNSVVAVTTAVLGIVLPYLLAVTVLPDSIGSWLLRVTPAAAFAVQQTAERYAFVDNL